MGSCSDMRIVRRGSSYRAKHNGMLIRSRGHEQGAYRRTCSGMHAHVVMCKYAGPSMCVGVCISIVDIILWLIRSVFTVLCTLYDVHYTMYSVHCTLYVVQCAMCILRFTLQDV